MTDEEKEKICLEAKNLEWINRALKSQYEKNEVRLDEITELIKRENNNDKP